MADDLVERLREAANMLVGEGWRSIPDAIENGIDELLRLRAALATAEKEAYERAAKICEECDNEDFAAYGARSTGAAVTAALRIRQLMESK